MADAFRFGRAFLAGDAAHLMTPFGARGLNSGVADAENLAWKLGLVAAGRAPQRLLESYDIERRAAAQEHLAVTGATMRFMAPHRAWRRMWRDLVLRLSPRSAWFRARVKSGRLYRPTIYAASPFVAPGPDDPALPRHGAVAPDVRLGERRLRALLGDRFVILLAGLEPGEAAAVRAAVGGLDLPVPADVIAPPDLDGRLRATYAPNGPRAWVIRPDAVLADSLALGGDVEPSGAALDQLPAMLSRAVGGAG